jgi:hypothetical protein
MADPTVAQLARWSTTFERAQLLVTAFTNRVAMQIDEFTNPAAASTTGLRAATATVTTARTTTSFSAGGVAALAAYPRTITVTTAGATAASAPASVLITGTDVDGAAQSETLVVSQTAATVTSAKLYKTVTSIVEAAADDVDATLAFGFGAALGLSRLPKLRAGAVSVLNENAVGARVTTGTFTLPASAAPYGSYTPSSAADGTRDYAITYELDLG